MSKRNQVGVGAIIGLIFSLIIYVKYIIPAEQMAWDMFEEGILQFLTVIINLIPPGSSFLLPALLALALVLFAFDFKDIAGVFEMIGDIIRGILRLF